MTNLITLYFIKFSPTYTPFCFFLHFFVARNLQLLGLINFSFCVYLSRSSPARSFFCSHFISPSFAVSFAPIFVAFQNLINSNIIILFASKLVIYLFSTWLWAYYMVPSFSNSVMSIWHSCFHLRY